jgi:hypothetical protein
MIAIEEAEAEARRVVASAPLAPYAEGFAPWLVARGYSRGSARHRLRQFRYLGGWIEQHGMSLEEVSEEALEAFLAARRAFGHVGLVTPRSNGLPLEYLREIGVVPPPAAVGGPVERLLEEYESYLRRERGGGEVDRLVHPGRTAVPDRTGASWRVGVGAADDG